MEKKNISLQIDKNLLKEFDAFAKSIGSTRAGLLSLFMKHCVIYRELPFKPGDRKRDGEASYDHDSSLYSILKETLAKYEEK